MLCVVVGQLNHGVVHEASKPIPLLVDIAERLAQRALGLDVCAVTAAHRLDELSARMSVAAAADAARTLDAVMSRTRSSEVLRAERFRESTVSQILLVVPVRRNAAESAPFGKARVA